MELRFCVSSSTFSDQGLSVKSGQWPSSSRISSPSLLGLDLAFHPPPTNCLHRLKWREREAGTSEYSWFPVSLGYQEILAPTAHACLFPFFRFTFLEMVRTLASPWPCRTGLPVSLEGPLLSDSFYGFVVRWWMWTCIPILVTECGLRKLCG